MPQNREPEVARWCRFLEAWCHWYLELGSFHREAGRDDTVGVYDKSDRGGRLTSSKINGDKS